MLTYLGILENLGRWRRQDEGNAISLLWHRTDKVTEASRPFRGGRHLGGRFETHEMALLCLTPKAYVRTYILWCRTYVGFGHFSFFCFDWLVMAKARSC